MKIRFLPALLAVFLLFCLIPSASAAEPSPICSLVLRAGEDTRKVYAGEYRKPGPGYLTITFNKTPRYPMGLQVVFDGFSP